MIKVHIGKVHLASLVLLSSQTLEKEHVNYGKTS